MAWQRTTLVSSRMWYAQVTIVPSGRRVPATRPNQRLASPFMRRTPAYGLSWRAITQATTASRVSWSGSSAVGPAIQAAMNRTRRQRVRLHGSPTPRRSAGSSTSSAASAASGASSDRATGRRCRRRTRRRPSRRRRRSRGSTVAGWARSARAPDGVGQPPRWLAVRHDLQVVAGQGAVPAQHVADRVERGLVEPAARCEHRPPPCSPPPTARRPPDPCPTPLITRRTAARRTRRGGGPGSSTGACAASWCPAPAGGPGARRQRRGRSRSEDLARVEQAGRVERRLDGPVHRMPTGPISGASQSRLSSPTPCSPVHVPPSARPSSHDLVERPPAPLDATPGRPGRRRCWGAGCRRRRGRPRRSARRTPAAICSMPSSSAASARRAAPRRRR